jgi:hypothetical protein
VRVAAMQASLDRQGEASTMSVMFSSSEHFDDSTSASSGTTRTGNDNGTNQLMFEDLDVIRKATDVARQQIAAAGDQLSSASRQRRLALLDQKERQAARVKLSEEDRTKALQSMLRIYEDDPSICNLGKINGRRAKLADPGAMVSATSTRNIDRFITPVDPNDTVRLHSFSGRREPMLCIGSSTEQMITVAIDGSLSMNVFKTYLLHGDTEDIDIMCTDDLVIAGGSIHFGTNERTSITQLVVGERLQYEFTDGRSYLVSATGGATPLETFRKLNYLVECIDW